MVTIMVKPSLKLYSKGIIAMNVPLTFSIALVVNASLKSRPEVDFEFFWRTYVRGKFRPSLNPL